MSSEAHTTFGPEQLVAIDNRMAREVADAIAEREHYWVAISLFRIVPPMEFPLVLDAENVRCTPSIVCWVCERGYRDELVDTRCTGEAA